MHQLMGGSPGRDWLEGEPRTSTLVFIGRYLPRELIEEGMQVALRAA